jgi:hypothetical protein
MNCTPVSMLRGYLNRHCRIGMRPAETLRTIGIMDRKPDRLQAIDDLFTPHARKWPANAGLPAVDLGALAARGGHDRAVGGRQPGPVAAEIDRMCARLRLKAPSIKFCALIHNGLRHFRDLHHRSHRRPDREPTLVATIEVRDTGRIAPEDLRMCGTLSTGRHVNGGAGLGGAGERIDLAMNSTVSVTSRLTRQLFAIACLWRARPKPIHREA